MSSGVEEPRVVAQPDRQEDRLVVDHRQHARALARRPRYRGLRNARCVCRGGARSTRRAGAADRRRSPGSRGRSASASNRASRDATNGRACLDVGDDHCIGSDPGTSPDPHRPYDLRARTNVNVHLDRRPLDVPGLQPDRDPRTEHSTGPNLDDAVKDDLAMDHVDAGLNE